MSGSVVIDVVIALALVFLVFSLVTSGLRELVARVLETRSKELWRSMRSLLEDPISSDLREIRAVAGRQEPRAREDLLEATAEAEEAIRIHLASGETARAWRARVSAALDPIRTAAAEHGVGGEVDAAVAAASRRLWIEHRSGRKAVLGLVRAGRRGGERPFVPQLPTQPNVAGLAAEVRRGTKTLTDAIHDHPLIRQLDKTWPGYHSRMRELASGDFSGALVDIVHAAGVEPTVKSSLSDVGREIDGLELTDDEKEELWEPVGAGFDRIEQLLVDGTATVDDYNALVDGIEELLQGEATRLQISQTELNRVRERVEASRDLVVRLHADPLAVVRAGAEVLADTAPVKNVLERLVARTRDAGDQTRGALDELRSSVETWYDSRMGSISAWYRKRSRFVAFGLALVVVIAFNVDAIGIPQDLWHDEGVRNVVVSVADQTSLGLEECLESSDTLSCVEGNVDALVDTGLPLGWDGGSLCDGTCDGIGEKISYAVGTEGQGPWGAAAKLFGWVLAAAALAMGASFWYDVLTRATGFKRARKAEQQGTSA